MEKCFFEVGKSYIDKRQNKFTVTKIDNNVIFTDRVIYQDEEICINMDFTTDSPLYEDLKVINQDPAAKKLIFVHSGGCAVCCDSLHEVSGNYETYAHIWSGKVQYFENKCKLTPEEIQRIENYAKSL